MNVAPDPARAAHDAGGAARAAGGAEPRDAGSGESRPRGEEAGPPAGLTSGTARGRAAERELHAATDDEIVRRIRSGEGAAAFDLIVARHGDDLFGVACSMVGNAADAEDVVQQALLGAYRRIGSFEGRSTLKTWLVSIVMNQASKALRSRRVRRALSLDANPDEGGPGAAAASVGPATATVDTQIDLVAMLATLSPDHREVIVLRELQRLTYDEIAAALKIPRGTVESRIFRARRELRERFAEYGK